jgi:thiopeptide-type bacteriocin biosynthesis protein
MKETPWKQVNITYRAEDREAREREAVAHLSPALAAAEAAGLISSWFFIRKQQWRVRYLPVDGAADYALARITEGVRWVSGIYEPEIQAFGGPKSMHAAHTLWHADSRNVLSHVSAGRGDRREQSLLLCTVMMRAAGLDLYEQGDVWARVADHRPVDPTDLPDSRTWTTFTEDVRRLLTGRARPHEPTAHWLTAFEDAGAALNTLMHDGALTRGIRAVIAHHILFHWNRFGFPQQTQATIAHAAKKAVFGEDHLPQPRCS